MNEEQDYRLLFISGAKDKLTDIKAAIKEVESQLASSNDNTIKLAVAWSRLCHEFMLNDAPKRAMLAIQERPVYPH